DNFLPEHPFDNGELNIRDEQLLPVPRTPEQLMKELSLYYGMVSEVDLQIGRVVDALEESGNMDNTIIVFASDNGLAMGQNGLIGKQSLYEHSVGVPMAIITP
ncbi:sulfatase-like hydrolase/transferase, partial [Bacillus altitudinis]